MQRRHLLQGAAALTVLGVSGCATSSRAPAKARVLVVGGGYSGATAARYVRLLSDHQIEVVIVEPDAAFVSCPLSNLVLGGSRQLDELTQSYAELSRQHGITVVRDYVSSIDAVKKTATLASGPVIAYDKLVLSPGVEMIWTA